VPMPKAATASARSGRGMSEGAGGFQARIERDQVSDSTESIFTMLVKTLTPSGLRRADMFR
jgi:hypothetical protein